MSQVLYRKYRPKTFGEVEGQEHVVRTLQGALMSGRIGHAYLFCGPRGTGKTTMARLLAKALNCTNKKEKESESKNIEPCNFCHSCTEINEGRSLGMIEIDAASNRGIDEIRNLKESASVATMEVVEIKQDVFPIPLKQSIIVGVSRIPYKIFIIDEVHMLTPPAFNALLKILEEPPSHVIFILATTEPYKVPDTILSRVQRFDFKKISLEHIQEKLKIIAVKEKLQIDDDAVATIAASSSGSLRDAESALNKLIAYSGVRITDEQVAEVLGIVPHHVHQKLLELIRQKKGQEAIAQVAHLYESGVDMDNFAKQFIKYLRAELISLLNKPVVTSSDQTEPEFLIKSINVFVKAASELKFSSIPQLPLELAILELVK